MSVFFTFCVANQPGNEPTSAKSDRKQKPQAKMADPVTKKTGFWSNLLGFDWISRKMGLDRNKSKRNNKRISEDYQTMTTKVTEREGSSAILASS